MDMIIVNNSSIHKNNFDLIGMGAGPFNLSIAALINPTNLKSAFFDRQDNYRWHAGMQIGLAKIQNSHLRDLVSLVDPTNEFSFTNFLHKTGRLESHLISNFGFIERREFEQYLKWTANKLPNIYLGKSIEHIDNYKSGFVVSVKDNKSDKVESFTTANIVTGVGPQPLIPNFARAHVGKNIFHNSQYKLIRSKLKGKRITIIGGGQSGLEIMLDLLNSEIQPKNIALIERRSFIQQIEDSQFAEDVVFTSGGTNKFYNLSQDQKRKSLIDNRITSDGASSDTIQELYQTLYRMKYFKENEFTSASIFQNSTVIDLESINNEINLTINNLDNIKTWKTDVVILATGYQQKFCSNIINDSILSKINFIDKDTPNIFENYNIDYSGKGNIYVVNGAKHTHGVVDPNLSLNAVRSAKIINNILSEAIYSESHTSIYSNSFDEIIRNNNEPINCLYREAS